MLERLPWRRLRQGIVPWLLALVLLVGPNSPFALMGASGVVYAQGASPSQTTQGQKGTKGTPNTFSTYLKQQQAKASSQPAKIVRASAGGPVVKAGTAGTPTPLQHPFHPSMQPGTLPLAADHAASFISSDKVLRLDVPAGALTAGDVAAAGGSLSLSITQVAGGSGSSAGGSGVISLSTYLIQLVDAHGQRPAFGLRRPITLTYALSTHELNLRVDRAILVTNGPRPLTLPLAPLATASAPPVPPTLTPAPLATVATSTPPGTATTTPTTTTAPASTRASTMATASTTATTATATTLANPTPTTATTATTGSGTSDGTSTGGWGQSATVPATLDPANETISAPLTMTASTATGAFDTFASVGTFGSPDPFTADLSGGGLTTSIPINVPAGPGGLTPPVQLAYSSASVNEQHNGSGAAPWVGEGWSLGLGAVTWAEHDVTADCVTSCGATWEDSWQISDPYGMGSDLIPPNNSVATYYDETTNTYYANGTYNYMPARWQTSNENYAKIISYVSGVTLPNQTVAPPCFRAWLTNGIMEEFGCTSNALQWYSTTSGDRVSAWYLDLITDPQGNQIHITYQINSTHTYPSDMVLSTIQYDAPGCHDANTACTGSAWQPRVQISFSASHSPTRRTGATPTGCNTGTGMRCDDPLDLSSANGEAAPTVQSTFVLNDIQVQVNPSGTGGWSLLRDYQLSYDQTAPASVQDPATGESVSEAGELALTKLQLTDENGATASSMPPETFGYSPEQNRYVDTAWNAQPTGHCGWTWNEPGGSSQPCPLWSVNHAGNNEFLTSADNGLGLHSTFTWVLGHNNTHGVNSGTTSDPTTCNSELVANTVCAQADDQNWSRLLLASRSDTLQSASQAGQGGTQTPTTTTTTANYTYALTQLTALQCPNCTYGYDWGNQNNGDYQDYYDTRFMGFAEAVETRSVTTTVGSGGTPHTTTTGITAHHYYSTQGIGVYDSSVPCFAENGYTCYTAPWWDLHNAAHGHEKETDEYTYAADGTTLLLLRKTTNSYHFNTSQQTGCLPAVASATPTYEGVSWDGQLVAETDHNNPVAVCDVVLTSSTTATYDGDGGRTGGDATTSTTATTYDTLGRVATTTTTVNGGSPTSVVHSYGYTQNSDITTTQTSAHGTYLLDFPAFEDTEDTASPANRVNCTYTSYDGASNHLGQTSTLVYGEPTETDTYTDCGTSSDYIPGGTKIATTTAYDSNGDPVASDDPDANAGASSHTGCTVGGTQYTTCTSYDALYGVLPVSGTNALNQTATIGYTNDSTGGYGLWPTSSTDPNSQTTTTAYDTFGRAISTTLPGETSGDTTSSISYSVTCATTGAQTPCAEEDSTQRLDSGTTVTTQSFYDGYGRLVESVSPAPGGQYVVQYTVYDPATGEVGFQSNPYFVSGSGYSIPDATQVGTSFTYDALGRVLTSENALSQTTTASYSIVNPALSGIVGGYYEQTTVIDANGHQSATLVDGWGRTAASETFTGNSASTYALSQQTIDTYDYAGNLVQVLLPDGTHTLTFSYDLAGRQTGMNDPDRGSESYSYDANGNVTKTVDARGASGTIYAGYDGLDRQTWRGANSDGSNPTVTYSYDSTANGNNGVGRLTSESFTGGPSNTWTGSYSYTYDGRGQPTASVLTVNGTPYSTSATYNDAGQPLTQTYPDGEVVATSYTSQGWLLGLSTTPAGQSAITLVDHLAYSGASGAFGLPTQYGLNGTTNGDTYTSAFTYDALGRPTDSKITNTSSGSTLFETSPSYDAVGNVAGVTTTLPSGSDSQSFTYDEQNRLTAASGTGTLGGSYSAAYSYDTLNRLTSSPTGSYTYGDSAHLDAATSVGSGYTASYDASGNMVCRAPTGTSTCTGSSTGQQLAYDNEGRLTSWQNAPSSPTSTANSLYDGEGSRVYAQTSSGGTTTSTTYIGQIEDVVTSGGTTTTTAYYSLGGQRVALSNNGTLSYLGSDLLGSAEVALDAAGNLTGSVLYSPYGNVRASSGSLPGTFGYTGQRNDTAITGLYNYGARYYDPTIGQFTSADTTLAGGLNRYAYVGGNPTSRTDPSGHIEEQMDDNIGMDGEPTSAGSGTGAGVGVAVGGVVSAVAAELLNDPDVVSLGGDLVSDPAGDVSVEWEAGSDVKTVYGNQVGKVLGTFADDTEGVQSSDIANQAAYEAAEAAAREDVPADPVDVENQGVERQAQEAASNDNPGCGGLSFSADTSVATPQGSQPISTLRVGDSVTAVDPTSGKTSTQTVQHVFLNHDTDLLDVTLRTTDTSQPTATPASDPDGKQRAVNQASHGSHAPPSAAATASATTTHDETVHTTANHPWLSADHGWAQAGTLTPGERVREADGRTATVVALTVVPGAADMWDLTVSNVHDFAVGNGAYVVHNCEVDSQDAAAAKAAHRALLGQGVRKFVVAVANVIDGDGNEFTVAALNQDAWTQISSDMIPATPADAQAAVGEGTMLLSEDSWLPEDLTTNPGHAHAEAYIEGYIRSRGLGLLDIGTSWPGTPGIPDGGFCPVCESRLDALP